MDIIKGTLDVLILKALSFGTMHGYAISRWVHDTTGGVLGVEDAALYQALHRLEKRDFVVSEWGHSENNRRAKFYELTAKGRRKLTAEDAQWRRYADAVFRVLDTG